MRKDLPHAIYYSFWGRLWERREVGAGMALPCVWWCRPPRGLEAGSRAKGRKQLGGKKQVLKSSPSAVPQLSEWRVMQSRAGALFHHSVTQLQGGGGGSLCKPSARGPGYASFVKPQCTPPLWNPAGKPGRSSVVESLETAERLFVLIALESGARRKKLLFSRVTLLGVVAKNGR